MLDRFLRKGETARHATGVRVKVLDASDEGCRESMSARETFNAVRYCVRYPDGHIVVNEPAYLLTALR